MKVTLVDVSGRVVTAHPRGSVAEIEKCPSCGVEPCFVRGSSLHYDHDTYYATATAKCCAQQVGELRAKVATIFGIEEDRNVLVHGRARVYGGAQ
ncbi:MAG: hypothetical protein ACTHU0_22155 [Kofleriaceae bacterium]